MSIMREVLRAFEEGRKQYEESVKMISAGGQQPDFTVCEVYGAGAKVCSAAASGGDSSREKARSADRSVDIDGKIASGDNLEYMMHLLRNEDMRGKVQLIYVDPPFFSGSRYEASVRLDSEKLGDSGLLKVGAYDDRWNRSIGEYLEMLTARLFMMRDLLSETGCLWVHLDWHSVHYVKLILDEIFGPENFVNEVVWNYKSGGATKRSFAKKHDTLLFYSKSRKYSFRPLREKSYNRELKPYHFKGVEEFCDDIGWYTMVNMKDVWSIDMVGRTSAERNGYATQKPEALLERIISSCSREGDICADLFAGSGTLGAVCQKMGRRWIMCDESRLGTAAQIERMGSCGAVFAVARGEYPGERCGRIAAKAAERSAGAPDVYGELTVKAADGRIELTGYGLEDAGTPGTAVDMAEPGVTSATDCTSEPGSASEPGKAGACGLYSGMCEPKSATKLKKYAQEDGLSLIKFWSIDTAYDGRVHRAENIISGKERSCEAGMSAGTCDPGNHNNSAGSAGDPADAAVLADSSGGSASANGARIVSVTGYDVLGNRFSKVMEIK